MRILKRHRCSHSCMGLLLQHLLLPVIRQLLHCLFSREMSPIWHDHLGQCRCWQGTSVHACTRCVQLSGLWEAAERICIGVLDASPVLHNKVMVLHSHQPPDLLAVGLRSRQQSQQGPVVCDQLEGLLTPMQIVPVVLDAPHCSHQLSFPWGVAFLMLIQRAAGTCHHVLFAVWALLA